MASSILDDLNKAMFSALVASVSGGGGNPAGIFQAEVSKIISQKVTQAYSGTAP